MTWTEESSERWLAKAQAEHNKMINETAPTLWNQIMKLHDDYANLQREIGRSEELITVVRNGHFNDK